MYDVVADSPFHGMIGHTAESHTLVPGVVGAVVPCMDFAGFLDNRSPLIGGLVNMTTRMTLWEADI